MTQRAAPHISVRGVGKSYGGVSVLRGIDLDIAPGEVHALVGENGAGKSTLLKVLGGAVRADAGEISFDGVVTTTTSPRDAIAHGVSLITQEGALVPAMTVLDNVVLGRWRARPAGSPGAPTAPPSTRSWPAPASTSTPRPA